MERPSPLWRTLVRAIIDCQTDLGWSQRTLARRAGLPHGTVNRLLRNRGSTVDLAKAERLAEVLGIRLDVTVPASVDRRPPGQRDAAHARCSSYVRARLESAGWDVEQEVEVRGWADARLDRHARVPSVGKGDARR
jgi:transcriptional regulator with XRE-family HTH domain